MGTETQAARRSRQPWGMRMTLTLPLCILVFLTSSVISYPGTLASFDLQPSIKVSSEYLEKRQDTPTAQYNADVTRGQRLVCAMADPDPNNNLQSILRVTSLFIASGYTTMSPPAPDWGDLTPAFRGFGVDENSFTCKEYLHSLPRNGVPPSGANFFNCISTSNGFIVAESNFGPAAMNAEIEPVLKSWSDIIFLQWLSQDTTLTSLPNIKGVMRHNIVNGETLNVIEKVLRVQAGSRNWASITSPDAANILGSVLIVTRGSEAFNALLGTPNGRGVGYFIYQHKPQMTIKTVTSITLFAYFDTKERQPAVNMVFDIGPV